MNEADLPSINLDELRLVPDWLREDAPTPSKQYASFDRVPGTDYQDRRGPRPGGPRRDSRDSRPGGGERRNDRGRSGLPPRGGAPRGRDDRPPARPESYQPVAAAPIRVEFLPDERCMVSIIKQIRSTHMAYPLFSLARMFLQEPARHYLQLSLVPGASQPGTSLYQLGEDGPVTLDRAALEAMAFDAMKDRFYKEESVQKDPPKGNFSNVARERTSGTLLGPTNYHAYQPALRALYESRFSRRMSFEDYRRNIEVSNDPALVERWKEEARTATTISTIEGEPPTIFPSNAETRLHFRQTYLEALLHKSMSFRLHGSVARRLPEPAMMQAIREAHEREVRYPAQFVQLLRQGLQNAGLHIFKHRKRIVYVAATRPTPFVASSGALTENVSLILETIAKSPLCTRKFLAERVLGKRFGGNRRPKAPVAPSIALTVLPPTEVAPTPSEAAPSEAQPDEPAAIVESGPVPAEMPVDPTPEGTPVESQVAAVEMTDGPVPPAPAEDEFSKAKAALAADLRFLVQAGHIIEFHNSTFDLPLPPKAKEEPTKSGGARAAVLQDESANSIGADPAALSEEERPVETDRDHPAVSEEVSDAPATLSPTVEESAVETTGSSADAQSEPMADAPVLELDAPTGAAPDEQVASDGIASEERTSEERA